MSKTILLALFVLSSVSLFAQSEDDEKAFHFGIGTALSLPTGDLKEGTSYGIGVEIQPTYAFAPNVEAFLQAGLHVFKDNSGYGDAANLLHIPVQVGARFKASGFFAGAGVGYGKWTSSGESLNGLMYSPQIGYDAGKLEVGANYTSTKVTGGTFSYFGLKLFRKF
jgi:predicted porin